MNIPAEFYGAWLKKTFPDTPDTCDPSATGGPPPPSSGMSTNICTTEPTKENS